MKDQTKRPLLALEAHAVVWYRDALGNVLTYTERSLGLGTAAYYAFLDKGVLPQKSDSSLTLPLDVAERVEDLATRNLCKRLAGRHRRIMPMSTTITLTPHFGEFQ